MAGRYDNRGHPQASFCRSWKTPVYRDKPRQAVHVRAATTVLPQFATGPSGTVPYWTVPDVDALVADWSKYGARAHRGPKTIMTGERLCQLLDPFGNLFGLRQPPP